MRKRVNAVIAAIFIVFISVVCVGTLIKHGRMYAYGALKAYKELLPPEPDVFDVLSARITKLDFNTKFRLLGRNALRTFNIRLQKALGKRIIEVSGAYMVKLKSGAWYTLLSDEFNEVKLKELINFAAHSRLPTALVYCHCGLYEDDLLPKGAELYDTNNAFADFIIDMCRENSLISVDSRDVYSASGMGIENAINKSDLHWTHRMALETARAAVDMVNKNYALGLDAEALNPEAFNDDLLPGLFMGEYGYRLGYANVPTDDIHLIYPKYATKMLYEELNDDLSPIKQREGSFYDAVIQKSNLELSKGHPFSESAYYIYGHYLERTHTVNEGAPDVRILVFKDSFGTPVSAFLGLAAREVYAVDLRASQMSLEEWVAAVKPDLVLFAYSQQMLRDYDYVITSE